MRLSVVIPTHRDTLKARARLLWAASWATDEIEVVIRDNSGSAAKSVWLATLDQPTVRVTVVEPCSAHTNFSEAVKLARGDFVLFQGDDDAAFDRGIAAMADYAARLATDPSVAALTGAYALEEREVSRLVTYAGRGTRPTLSSGWTVIVGYQGPNLVFYSAIRRQLAFDAFGFMARHPFQLPFHDNLFSLIYLLAGRLVGVGRFTVIYDNANWDAVNTAQENDLRYYRAAGMDPIIRQIHWLLCGFEGACIALRTPFGAACSSAQRQAAASKWFELMLRRFAGDRGQSFGSALVEPANAITERVWASLPSFALDRLLDEICALIAIFSEEKAALYRDFWGPMISD